MNVIEAYMYQGRKDELISKLIDSKKLHYFGDVYYKLFNGWLPGYHHEEGATFFVAEHSIMLIGNKEHISATRKSLDEELKIKLE
jgi:hypothetical protein